ncbi:hypothetical protein EYC84_006023 [Monilinia fructicola]|uniref:Uncharacterized protein n=1 Tax=Monilinia fructicola TaxID=38448 RepID=A0A5M9K134_MONFR|nr:hypothetical protein EYC84_006023 [Monilinia fructicola]
MMNRQSLSQYLLFNIMRFSQVEKCTKSILTSVGVQNSFYITLGRMANFDSLGWVGGHFGVGRRRRKGRGCHKCGGNIPCILSHFPCMVFVPDARGRWARSWCLGGSDWGKRDESGGSEMKNRDDRLGDAWDDKAWKERSVMIRQLRDEQFLKKDQKLA